MKSLLLILLLMPLMAIAQKRRPHAKPQPQVLTEVVDIDQPMALMPPFRHRGHFQVVEKDKKTGKWLDWQIDYFIHSTDSTSSHPEDIVVDFYPNKPVKVVAKIEDWEDHLVKLEHADSSNNYSCVFSLTALDPLKTYELCLCDDHWYCIQRILFRL